MDFKIPKVAEVQRRRQILRHKQNAGKTNTMQFRDFEVGVFKQKFTLYH